MQGGAPPFFTSGPTATYHFNDGNTINGLHAIKLTSASSDAEQHKVASVINAFLDPPADSCIIPALG